MDSQQFRRIIEVIINIFLVFNIYEGLTEETYTSTSLSGEVDVFIDI